MAGATHQRVAGHFSIDVCAYAMVMSNHILYCVDQDKARTWIDAGAIKHRSNLFPGYKTLVEVLTLKKGLGKHVS